MFGDIIRERLKEEKLKNAKNDKTSEGFYEVLKAIIKEDIIACGTKVDSDKAIRLYRKILKENEELLPDYIKVICKSNKQPKYEISIRNILKSNAFHSTGLANDPELIAYRVSKETYGTRTVYKKKG